MHEWSMKPLGASKHYLMFIWYLQRFWVKKSMGRALNLALLAVFSPVYSASYGATGGVSLTWMPPLFLSLLSWKGSLQPPSSSGVLSHSLIRCLRGAGGGKSLYAVLACRTWLFDKNWISPMSKII